MAIYNLILMRDQAIQENMWQEFDSSLSEDINQTSYLGDSNAVLELSTASVV